MSKSRLAAAIASGLFALPATGPIGVWGPRPEDDLTALPAARLMISTGFRPDVDHFQRLGLATGECRDAVAALVFVPRSRARARALLAEAVRACRPGAPVAVDGHKRDGIESLLADLGRVTSLSAPLSARHGKIAVFPAAPLPDAWTARPVHNGGFTTIAGVFSADGPDPGSMLLASVLPDDPGPVACDLGAGWGYLARGLLERPTIRRLDLVEAERLALDCARENIRDSRAHFIWADAFGFDPGIRYDTIVMNPPFHDGRTADPAIGIGFIHAAHRLLARGGVLWMVANGHLPYGRTLAQLFADVRTPADNGAFRVYRAARPKTDAATRIFTRG